MAMSMALQISVQTRKAHELQLLVDTVLESYLEAQIGIFLIHVNICIGIRYVALKPSVSHPLSIMGLSRNLLGDRKLLRMLLCGILVAVGEMICGGTSIGYPLCMF